MGNTGDIGGRCIDCKPGTKGDKGERGLSGMPGLQGLASYFQVKIKRV